jgi:hypothetical protein
MESSELFLIAWATIATVLAIYFRHKMIHFKIAIIVQQIGIRMIGENKAKVIIEGDRVLIREV